LTAVPAIKLPQEPFVDKKGDISRSWRLWLLNPQFITLNLDTVLGITSGGTGLTATPAAGQLLIGNGVDYNLNTLSVSGGLGITNGPGTITLTINGIDATQIVSGFIPAARFPALTGDISNSAGSLSTVLATVNATVGSFGSASSVATFTVNGKGLVTASGSTPIAIANTAVSGLGTLSTQNANTVAITGGSVNGTSIGNSTPSTGVFTGVSTNSNAATGVIGEYIESILASSSGVSLTTGTVANVTSISLTAGDWDVSGVVAFNLNAGTLGTTFVSGLTSTSATFGPEYTVSWLGMATGINSPQNLVTPVIRFSLASTTTIYLVADSVFTVSTMKAGGLLRARRVR
jgi:hypothetical protein